MTVLIVHFNHSFPAPGIQEWLQRLWCLECGIICPFFFMKLLSFVSRAINNSVAEVSSRKEHFSSIRMAVTAMASPWRRRADDLLTYFWLSWRPAATCLSQAQEESRGPARVPHKGAAVNADSSVEQSRARSLMWGEKFWERAAPSSCHVTRLAARSSAGVWALLQGSALHKNMSAFQLNATLKNSFSSTPGPEKRLPALGARDISAISLYFQVSFTVLWFPLFAMFQKKLWDSRKRTIFLG